MLTNKSDYEDAFDKMLRCGLKKHIEPDRPDFGERLLRQIETGRQQKILAKVVFEERLALAGSIILPLAAVTVFLFFPEIPRAVSGWVQNLFAISLQTVLNYVSGIQFWYILIIISGIAVYCIFDFVVEEF
jgi:sterol desaturase/sphingolipid hydroxylase (fatty acid hydroxylase superfamily)